jgi:hypothetical protein
MSTKAVTGHTERQLAIDVWARGRVCGFKLQLLGLWLAAAIRQVIVVGRDGMVVVIGYLPGGGEDAGRWVIHWAHSPSLAVPPPR